VQVVITKNIYYKTVYNSPIGEILLLCDKEENLVGSWIVGQKYFANGFSVRNIAEDSKYFIKAKNWLDKYFKLEAPNVNELSLKPIGSAFRQEVWKIISEIPYGQVITYSDIANLIAHKRGLKKMSAQAVGSAVGHNPISVIIPCHRVIGTNGKLGGYSAGADIKRKLLELEKCNIKLS